MMCRLSQRSSNDNSNDYKFCNVIDIVTSIVSVILLIITQILDYMIDSIISIIYITQRQRIILSKFSLLLAMLCTIYDYCISIIVSIIDIIVIIMNKIRVMIMINSNDNDDEHLRTLAYDAGITINTINITTCDGYILGLHRCSKIDNKKQTTSKAPVVLLLHGLLQSSDSFITGGKLSLASTLVNNGYDVWIGNTRGNKYSNKHVVYNEHDRRYWNFCLDDYAKYDVPAMILYIRNYTSIDKMSLIGFSQGSAEVFGSLSIHPTLNNYVNLFIALAPPIKPIGMSDNILSKLIHIYPNITNVILGYKSCFPYMPTIQKMLGLQLYTTICTYAMNYLFGWNCLCISPERRLLLFKSIFSSSSVKGIKHWFQMVKAQQLQIYHNNNENEIYERNNIDNTIYNTDNMKRMKKLYDTNIEPPYLFYDLTNIECKVAVLAGAEDKLIDPYIVEKKVKNCLITYVVPNYEHLDLLWADDACKQVFPKILKLLDKEKNNN